MSFCEVCKNTTACKDLQNLTEAQKKGIPLAHLLVRITPCPEVIEAYRKILPKNIEKTFGIDTLPVRK